MSRLTEIAQRLLAITDVGLQFASNGYDKDRNAETRKLALEMMALATTYTIEDLQDSFPLTENYPTPKVDVRAVVFNPEGQLLFVRERADSLWALPGGWAEIGYTPGEVAEKECREETGLRVSAQAIWAIIDKKGWGHPVPLYATYKIFLHCTYQEGLLIPGYEVLDAQFFSQDNLPGLSIERNTSLQIQFLFKKRDEPNVPVLFN